MDKFTVLQARKLSNISQKEMAKKMHLSERAYVNKEKGKTRFYVNEAVIFCKIVGLDIENVFFDSIVP